MKHLVVGIDPGKKGALVALHAETGQIVGAFDTPTEERNYDEMGMVKILEDAKPRIQLAVLERPVLVPLKIIGGKVPSWNSPRSIAAQWEGYALWRGILLGLKIPFVEVTPKQWQKDPFSTLGKEGKKRSYIYASRRWPDGPWRGSQGGIREDRCDAALIALYKIENKQLGEPDDSVLDPLT
jgi:hypothetical protein